MAEFDIPIKDKAVKHSAILVNMQKNLSWSVKSQSVKLNVILGFSH